MKLLRFRISVHIPKFIGNHIWVVELLVAAMLPRVVVDTVSAVVDANPTSIYS